MTDNLIKPYGDTLNDGRIQLSFTLPVENGPRASKAAEQYAALLNLTEISVVHAAKLAENFTLFVVYATARPVLDYDTVTVQELAVPSLNFSQINELIRSALGRKIVVIGATIGSDAHTVGIDAIMNMKGYNHDYGLERYPEIDAINLGAQVTPEALVDTALQRQADAILVSQTVTQKSSHRHNFSALVDLLGSKNIRDRFLLIAGGPRVSHELALELGYDAGFGPGTRPSAVAAYIAQTLSQKQKGPP